jgi:hypothetical protein
MSIAAIKGTCVLENGVSEGVFSILEESSGGETLFEELRNCHYK